MEKATSWDDVEQGIPLNVEGGLSVLGTPDMDWRTRYMRLIGEDLLDRDEERTLGEVIREGEVDENHRPVFESTEQEDSWYAARNELVEKNLRLVVTIAHEFKRKVPTADLDDLISEGNRGLIRAAEKYNPSKGTKFSSYARWWIREKILRFLNERYKGIGISVTINEHIRKLAKARQVLREQGSVVTDESLSDITGLSLAQVQKYKEVFPQTHSLQGSVTDGAKLPGDERTLEEVLPDENFVPVQEKLVQSDNEAMLRNGITHLDDFQQLLLVLRFGLDSWQKATLEEVSMIINRTRERVRQIEDGAKQQLKRLTESGEVLLSPHINGIHVLDFSPFDSPEELLDHAKEIISDKMRLRVLQIIYGKTWKSPLYPDHPEFLEYHEETRSLLMEKTPRHVFIAHIVREAQKHNVRNVTLSWIEAYAMIDQHHFFDDDYSLVQLEEDLRAQGIKFSYGEILDVQYQELCEEIQRLSREKGKSRLLVRELEGRASTFYQKFRKNFGWNRQMIVVCAPQDIPLLKSEERGHNLELIDYIPRIMKEHKAQNLGRKIDRSWIRKHFPEIQSYIWWGANEASPVIPTQQAWKALRDLLLEEGIRLVLKKTNDCRGRAPHTLDDYVPIVVQQCEKQGMYEITFGWVRKYCPTFQSWATDRMRTKKDSQTVSDVWRGLQGELASRGITLIDQGAIPSVTPEEIVEPFVVLLQERYEALGKDFSWSPGVLDAVFPGHRAREIRTLGRTEEGFIRWSLILSHFPKHLADRFVLEQAEKKLFKTYPEEQQFFVRSKKIQIMNDLRLWLEEEKGPEWRTQCEAPFQHWLRRQNRALKAKIDYFLKGQKMTWEAFLADFLREEREV